MVARFERQLCKRLGERHAPTFHIVKTVFERMSERTRMLKSEHCGGTLNGMHSPKQGEESFRVVRILFELKQG